MHTHRVTETHSDSRQRRFKVDCRCDMDVILSDWRIPPYLERPKDGPWAGLCVLEVEATHSKGGWVVLVRYGKPPQAMTRKRDRLAT